VYEKDICFILTEAMCKWRNLVFTAWPDSSTRLASHSE